MSTSVPRLSPPREVNGCVGAIIAKRAVDNRVRVPGWSAGRAGNGRDLSRAVTTPRSFDLPGNRVKARPRYAQVPGKSDDLDGRAGRGLAGSVTRTVTARRRRPTGLWR
jgi:hypothetical protein